MPEADRAAYTDSDKRLALELAVEFYARTGANPATTPTSPKKILELADILYHWMTT